jgi:hypothetical protein
MDINVYTVLKRGTCGDCGRVFDLLDEMDAEEWHYGHDCEDI